jgi:hypothetical protein
MTCRVSATIYSHWDSNPPASIAPLEVVGGVQSHQEGAEISPAKPIVEWSITIGEGDIGNREAVTRAYLEYVLSQYPVKPMDLEESMNFSGMRFWALFYINASYWNQKHNDQFPFTKVLNKFGDRNFADRLAIRSFQIAAADPSPDKCITLKAADSSIDSESARWPDIAKLENCKN